MGRTDAQLGLAVGDHIEGMVTVLFIYIFIWLRT